MYAEKALIRVHRDLKVHTCFYPNPTTAATIILVNGSLATSVSFNASLKYLRPLFNVVVYDLPYQGQSRGHNLELPLIGKEDEALILLELIEHFSADHLLAFSWGSVAALLALAQRPARINKAIISSFSPVLNPFMLDYLSRARAALGACDRQAIGNLLNDTIGEHLPPLFKRCNFRHVSALEEFEYAQMLYHIRQVAGLDCDRFMSCVENVDAQLLFINGELDRYTSPADARLFSHMAPHSQFTTIRHTGHFLELEHKTAWQDVKQAVERFVLEEGVVDCEQRMAMVG
ncbi:alpha/beta fold hydrolase [Halopseudomonas pelagia]|uniref:Alpha/beta hydrolase n=1 Tax=Halopseudomonas pelagia TaxID=553151 RepID=A0AA91Z459_9GAMM|nr:alpha/beta hydrolase [Halopseudomonas pelagia]PCC97562.1 alpha/beta hydrolase [Halopseudomonas pelagia]QFY57877.1 alpha/beta hydrolase [Halopseudomonas pelagia]